MSLLPYALARHVLFQMDAEHAHELTLASLAQLQKGPLSPLSCLYAETRVHDPLVLAGLHFPNRIGLAAGLDKNGACIDGLARMGFGFIEVGTVTPLPQSGNPKPRMFRLPQAEALINRLGFNNEGLERFIRNVKNAHFRAQGGILGLNIGKNAVTPIDKAVDDYLVGLSGVYPYADYITVNISSPNTKNLRELQNDESLNQLLQALKSRQQELSQEHGRYAPIFLKIAPDLEPPQIQGIAQALLRHQMDGVIATNTTVSRDAVSHLPHAQETGGLSGAPVLQASNAVIRSLRQELGAHFPIIGVGGVTSAASAISKMEAGADVVQIYTGLIYHGPALVRDSAQAIKAWRATT